MITREYISKKAADKGFSAAYCCAPLPEDRAPEGVKTFILLLRAYQAQDGLVDAFYPASNAAYHAAHALAEEIKQECETQTWVLSNLHLKPICTRAPGFARGLNTLNYRKEYGSKFCLEMIGLSEAVSDEEKADSYVLPCETCRRCMQACPGGAISPDGFVKEKCIRFYMLNGKPMPEHLRPYIGAEQGSYAVLGCDICQRVCPGNAQTEAMRDTGKYEFTLEELLQCTPETLQRFGEIYGRNYAVRNRIIAQALLAAGNSGDLKYLPYIEVLRASASPAVQEHAAWAAENIKKIQNNY